MRETQTLKLWCWVKQTHCRKMKWVENSHAPNQLMLHQLLFHKIPSFSTSNSVGISDVAGTHTWSDMVGLGSGVIYGFGIGSAVGSSVAVIELMVVAGALTFSSFLQMVKGEPLWRSTHYPFHILHESPYRLDSGQVQLRLV